MPDRKRSGPTSTAGHISAKRSARPARGTGEARNPFTLKFHLQLSAFLPRTTKQTAAINSEGTDVAGRCAGLSGDQAFSVRHHCPRRASTPLRHLASGRARSHSALEREGERVSPSAHGQGRPAASPGSSGMVKLKCTLGSGRGAAGGNGGQPYHPHLHPPGAT